jgi:hypothetical protein
VVVIDVDWHDGQTEGFTAATSAAGDAWSLRAGKYGIGAEHHDSLVFARLFTSEQRRCGRRRMMAHDGSGRRAAGRSTPKPPPARVPVEYAPLYRYLDNRFASCVTLTFAEGAPWCSNGGPDGVRETRVAVLRTVGPVTSK